MGSTPYRVLEPPFYTFDQSPALAPAYEESVSQLQIVRTHAYPIQARVSIRTWFRSIPHLGSEPPQHLLSSSVTQPLLPAFHSITPFRYAPPTKRASLLGTDTAENVERSLDLVTASCGDCGSTSLVAFRDFLLRQLGLCMILLGFIVSAISLNGLVPPSRRW